MENKEPENLQIEVLAERVKNWMESTTEYRKSLCNKLDIITERVNALPCKGHIQKFDKCDSDIGWLQKIAWATGGFIFIIVIPAMVSLAVGWGETRTTVLRNTGIIQEMQQLHTVKAVSDGKVQA